MKKKVLSVVLSIVIVFSSCCVGLYVYAENKTVDVNKELLESLLNDRRWVIETLANGDLSNNPYREAAMIPDQTLMEDVLENYQDDADFKLLVDAMEVYANSGQYVSGFADTTLTSLMGKLGLDNIEIVRTLLDDVVASTAELKYESIFNEVLLTDYTSSWGETLYEENMTLEYMKQLGSMLHKLPAYQTLLQDIVGLHGTTSSSIIIYDPYKTNEYEFEIDLDTYANHFLDAYEQDLEAALVNAIDISGVEGNEALEKKILAASYLGLVHAYERVILPDIEYHLDDLYYDGMYENTMAIMKGAGKVMSVADKTMDYAILMESLCSQKTSLVETMGRIEQNTTDEDLAKVLNYYATLVENQGNANIIAYENITDYLRNEQVITNFVSKKVATGVPKLLESAVFKYGRFSDKVLYCSISRSLKEVAGLAALTIWVADIATGIKDTAKKIYVLKYLDKIITQAEDAFYSDLQAYKNNKTEENAAAVLNDLEFLKELRLYGEKTAYGSMSGQMTSWLGLLLGGGETVEYIDYRYQGMIDTFLGSTLSPISQNKLVLSKGDTLIISTDKFSNNPEKTYTYATWEKASGEKVYFAEPELRCFAGIDLNGATLQVLKADDGFYLPVVDNDTDGAAIEIYCNNVAFGSITNSAEMSIYQKKSGVSYDVTERITNSGTLNLIGFENSANINTYEYDNKGTINITDTGLNLISTGKNNGTINGMVNVCGGNAYYENSYYTVEKQVLLGTGTYSHLNFINNSQKGVTIGGKTTVTDYICNSSTRLHTSENITVTNGCTIANNYFKGGLSFDGYSTNDSFTLDGSALIYNNVTFGGPLVINDSLNLTTKCQTLTLNGETLVKGDFLYEAGVIDGIGKLSLKGDANITASSPSISYLNFVSSTSQTFSSKKEISVDNLTITNTSFAGFIVNGTIKVTNCFNDKCKNLINSENIILSSNALWLSDGQTKNDATLTGIYTVKAGESLTVNGDLSLNSGATLIIEDGATVSVNGDLNTKNSNITIYKESVFSVNGSFTTSSSKINIVKGADLQINDYFKSSNDTLNIDGNLTIKSDCRMSSSTVNASGLVTFKGDLHTSSCTFNRPNICFDSKVGQTVSGSAINVNNLMINNASKSGVTFNSKVNYYGEYDSGTSAIHNSSNVIDK